MLALTFYDWLMTASEEISLIWKHNLSCATILYLLNRYGALVFGWAAIAANVLRDSYVRPCHCIFVSRNETTDATSTEVRHITI